LLAGNEGAALLNRSLPPVHRNFLKRLKRFDPLPHYLYVERSVISRSGEPQFRDLAWQIAWSGFSKVPEAAGGKRIRHFVNSLFPKYRVRNDHPNGVSFPVRMARSNSPVGCRRGGLTLVQRPAPVSEATITAPSPVLHCLTLQNARGKYLQFQSFDAAYITRLQLGDFRTQEHFSSYFGALIKIKLGSRLNSREAIEDLRQETFTRFFAALKAGKILQPDRLGAFVNSICNNVLLEHYRASGRNTSIEDEDENSFPAADFDLVGSLGAKEREKKVKAILEELSERDRRLLKEVFLEERDKDEVCRDFGIDREYLRVLLHRAKQAFKSAYLKRTGENPPDYSLA
jgi:RNA polymerase sigma-70 factor (ECF subfamily)